MKGASIIVVEPLSSANSPGRQAFKLEAFLSRIMLQERWRVMAEVEYPPRTKLRRFEVVQEIHGKMMTPRSRREGRSMERSSQVGRPPRRWDSGR